MSNNCLTNLWLTKTDSQTDRLKDIKIDTDLLIDRYIDR